MFNKCVRLEVSDSEMFAHQRNNFAEEYMHDNVDSFLRRR